MFGNPATVELPCYQRSGDGQYWLRYPQGNKPFPSMFSDASVDATVHGALNTGIRLGGSGSILTSASANLTTTPHTGSKKFNGGHYGEFSTVVFGPTPNISRIQNDLNQLKPYTRVLGYLASVTHGALEPQKGETDVTPTYPQGYATGAAFVKTILDELTNVSKYTTPRRLALKMQIGAFTQSHPGTTDWSVIPQYIQTDSTYGIAGYRVGGVVTKPVGRYGLWGGDGNGNTYAICMHRSACAARVFKCMAIIASYFDTHPYFEEITLDENSFWLGASSANACPDYSFNATDTNIRSPSIGITTVNAAAPNTAVAFENSYYNTFDLAASLNDFMLANDIDWSNTDCLGLTYSQANGNRPYTWGAQSMCGFNSTGGSRSPNYSALNYGLFPETQATDLGAYGHAGLPGGYAKEDILAGHIQILRSKKVFWSIMVPPATPYGSQLKPNSTWDFMGPWLNDPANFLPNAATPPVNY